MIRPLPCVAYLHTVSGRASQPSFFGESVVSSVATLRSPSRQDASLSERSTGGKWCGHVISSRRDTFPWHVRDDSAYVFLVVAVEAGSAPRQKRQQG